MLALRARGRVCAERAAGARQAVCGRTLHSVRARRPRSSPAGDCAHGGVAGGRAPVRGRLCAALESPIWRSVCASLALVSGQSKLLGRNVNLVSKRLRLKGRRKSEKGAKRRQENKHLACFCAFLRVFPLLLAPPTTTLVCASLMHFSLQAANLCGLEQMRPQRSASGLEGPIFILASGNWNADMVARGWPFALHLPLTVGTCLRLVMCLLWRIVRTRLRLSLVSSWHTSTAKHTNCTWKLQRQPDRQTGWHRQPGAQTRDKQRPQIGPETSRGDRLLVSLCFRCAKEAKLERDPLASELVCALAQQPRRRPGALSGQTFPAAAL